MNIFDEEYYGSKMSNTIASFEEFFWFFSESWIKSAYLGCNLLNEVITDPKPLSKKKECLKKTEDEKFSKIIQLIYR